MGCSQDANGYRGKTSTFDGCFLVSGSLIYSLGFHKLLSLESCMSYFLVSHHHTVVHINKFVIHF